MCGADAPGLAGSTDDFDSARCTPRRSTWTGADAEKKCLAFQKETLRALNADAETIAYIEACAENPTYQGHNTGWRSWLDYLKRWW